MKTVVLTTFLLVVIGVPFHSYCSFLVHLFNNLPSQYEVVLDSNGLIHELINRLLDQVNSTGDAELSELILSFANQEIAEGRNWNRMRDSLHVFLKISLEEKFLAIEPHLALFQVNDFLRLEDQLRSLLHQMLGEVKSVADSFIQIIDSLGFPDAFYYYGGTGPVGNMRSFLRNPEIADKAVQSARAIAQGLDYVGVLCLEFFVLANGELVVNEMAPRPHNSGHYTMNACDVSQFDLQVRSLARLPLVQPRQHSPAIMLNILGDLWFKNSAEIAKTPAWAEVLALPGCHLHLYGKLEARKARKMGHLNITAATTDQVKQVALQACEILGIEAF